MAVTSAHVLYAIQTPAGIIDQITSSNLDLGIEELVQAGDGKVDPEYAATINQSPVLNFTTPALSKALAIAGINGLGVSTPFDFFFQKVALGGTRATGTNHVKLTFSNGLLLPRRMRATDGSEATIEYDMLAIAPDDSNSPLVVAANQALAGTPLETEKFTVGPVKVAGTLINGITDIDVDFAIQEMMLRGDGSAFPTFAAIQERRPQITLRTLDSLLLSTFKTTEVVGAGTTDHHGQIALSAANPGIVSFRKIAQGGVRVNPTSASHVVLTINEGRFTVRNTTATDREAQDNEAMITPTFDSTNDIIAISLAGALPS